MKFMNMKRPLPNIYLNN